MWASYPYTDFNYREKLELFNKQVQRYDQEYSAYQLGLSPWNERFQEKTKEIYDSTKVVFLSATPFAYVKSCIIGDGTLWETYATGTKHCGSRKK